MTAPIRGRFFRRITPSPPAHHDRFGQIGDIFVLLPEGDSDGKRRYLRLSDGAEKTGVAESALKEISLQEVSSQVESDSAPEQSESITQGAPPELDMAISLGGGRILELCITELSED